MDEVKKKISLTLKTSENPHGIAVGNQKTDRERKQGRREADKRKERRNAEPQSKEELLKALYKKFGR